MRFVHQPKLTKLKKKRKKKCIVDIHTCLRFPRLMLTEKLTSEIEQAQGVSDTYWTRHNQGCSVTVSLSIPVKMLLACHTDTYFFSNTV